MTRRGASAGRWLRGPHRWWVLLPLVAAIAVTSAWLSFELMPSATVRVGAVKAEIRAVPGTGTVVRAAEGRPVTDATVNHGPLQVQVDLALGKTDRTTEPQLLAGLRASRPALVNAAVRYLLGVAGGALVLTLLGTGLLLGATRRRLVAGGLTSVVVMVGGVGATAATTRLSAFDAASCAHGWSRYAMANLPALTPPAPLVRPPAGVVAAANPGLVGVVLMSDDHLNPEGLRYAQALVQATGAQAVLDAGDTTSYGISGEACVVAPLIRGFRVPYVWVRGNHDSAAFEQVMKAIPGVRVLDGTEATVAGIDVYGVGDPSFTPRRALPAGQMEARDAAVRAALPTAIDQLPADPDVALVHECQLAVADDPSNSGVAGRVPLVVCGHTHRYAEAVVGSTTLLHTGTVGAGGLAVAGRSGPTDFVALLLYFSADAPHRLVKYYVVDGRGGAVAGFTEHLAPLPPPAPFHRVPYGRPAP